MQNIFFYGTVQQITDILKDDNIPVEKIELISKSPKMQLKNQILNERKNHTNE